MNKKKILIILAIVLGLVIIGFGIAKVVNKKKEDGVVVKEITTGDFSDSVTVSGTVSSKNVVKVMAKDNIKLEKLNYEVGDKVKVGDKLFSMDMTSFEQKLENINGDIESGELTVQKLNTSKMAIASSDELLKQSELMVETATSDLDYARAELEKNKKLFEIGAISKDAIDKLSRAVDMAITKLDNAKLDLAKVKEQVAVANANDANQNNIKELDKEMAINNVEKARTLLDDTTKHIDDLKKSAISTMNGTVSMVAKDDYEGNNVPAGTLLYEISDLDNMYIRASVKESEISSIALGNEVIITGEGIKKNAVVKGKVSFISPVAVRERTKNGERSVVEIKIDITEGVAEVMSGFDTECEIISKSQKDVILVSFDMMVKEDYKDYVFVVGADNKVEKREVVLGDSSDFDAMVLSGLEVGEKVIINPAVTVRDGIRVNIKED